MKSRHLLILLFVSLMIVAFIVSARTGNATPQATTISYCASDVSSSVVYFSEIYETKLTRAVLNSNDPRPNEYFEYLKGRYDYKTNSNYPVGCPTFDTRAQAATSKQALEAQVRRGNSQVIEVPWSYIGEPGEVAVSVPRQHRMEIETTSPLDHTFCISETYNGVVYVTGPFDTRAMNFALWNRGFIQFLKQKYSFQGTAYCYGQTRTEAQRLLNAHIDGAHAANRRVVETGWMYDASAATTQAAPRPTDDDDRVPTHKAPVATSPSMEARDFARKEAPAGMAYCARNRMMNGPFDCGCLQSLIRRYRLDHPSDTLSANPTPLASLFEGDRFDCTACILDMHARFWAESQAQSAHLALPAAKCAADKFIPLLHAKPYPTRTKESMDAAINACRQ